MDVLNLLSEFLKTEIAYENNMFSIDPDEDILTRGLIDSMSIMSLSAFIEKTFVITIDVEDMIPENFQTLNSIKDFINKKMISKK